VGGTHSPSLFDSASQSQRTERQRENRRSLFFAGPQAAHAFYGETASPALLSLLRNGDDPNREMTLAVMAFDVPQP
jgi:hypothetical protein